MCAEGLAAAECFSSAESRAAARFRAALGSEDNKAWKGVLSVGLLSKSPERIIHICGIWTALLAKRAKQGLADSRAARLWCESALEAVTSVLDASMVMSEKGGLLKIKKSTVNSKGSTFPDSKLSIC